VTQDLAGRESAAAGDSGGSPPRASTAAEQPDGTELAAPAASDGGATAAAGDAQQAMARPRFGVIAWLRWCWRQLTSMRTALVLLFLLALAAIPGSVLPQEGIDPAAVSRYYTEHPALAPFLAKLSAFNAFGAPWFAAIYLLLFTSLAGCVLPRTFRLLRSARQPPPQAPKYLRRLPHSASFATATGPDQALESVAAMLRRRRFRLRTGAGWVSAEKGYLHEVGNLLFHMALLGLLGSVALGGLFGYKGNRLLVAGQTFANQVPTLDVFRPGRLVTASDLQPFTVTLNHFYASYVRSGPERGQPASFNALVRYATQPGAPEHSYDLQVNHPLNIDGVQVFLIGHGYAPIFSVTDGTGKVVFSGPVPFIPLEQSGLTSAGVIKVPDAKPEGLGFAGVFLPTAVDVDGRLASAYPAALLPRVSLVSYAGDLGMNDGLPQSVYSLDTSHMRRLAVRPVPLAPGQSITLPRGLGKLTFVGYRQWASLAITYDPGQLPALISALTALAGLLLSFTVRRRRLFVRAATAADGGEGGGPATVVTVGGLTRSDAAGGFETEFAELTSEIMQSLSGDGTAVIAAQSGGVQAVATQTGASLAGATQTGASRAGASEAGASEAGGEQAKGE
jgi:cytochrome c biogenesis protein